jgi:hypothetical protein
MKKLLYSLLLAGSLQMAVPAKAMEATPAVATSIVAKVGYTIATLAASCGLLYADYEIAEATNGVPLTPLIGLFTAMTTAAIWNS